ncbi:hypothetical protein ABOM_012124 [Aspergillus bombycis]|uniref:Uncharacterized protein n=1 Tax=Aspergillus bombycis TaxID=109264 RepID=A0A1F7ZIB9_9EURO|nr:hypothetical protein ABOM_012124 [Aspergillus bombycis]OGM39206.1 hypothetical protein ABOM_012124 [Aspergillus bombycis]
MLTGDDFGGLHTRQFQGEKEGGEADDGELLAPVVCDYDDRARHHTAGVTAILPLSVEVEGGAPVVLTGSYDEPYACIMRRGAGRCWRRLVRVTRTLGEDAGWEIEVLAEFTEHQSMNYASDVWKPDGGYDLQGKETSELLCISSSFYDRRLCLWRVNV